MGVGFPPSCLYILKNLLLPYNKITMQETCNFRKYECCFLFMTDGGTVKLALIFHCAGCCRVFYLLTSSPVFPFLIFLLLVTLNNTLLLEVPGSFCIDSLYVR